MGKPSPNSIAWKLRDNTLIVFTSDNGTGGVYADESTIGGRRLAGEKGSMLEGGALVPMIVNWPGMTSPGRVSSDLVDSKRIVPTFAELAGVELPEKRSSTATALHPRCWASGETARLDLYRTGEELVRQGRRMEAQPGGPLVRHDEGAFRRAAGPRRHD